MRRYKFHGPYVPIERVGGDFPRNSETRSGRCIGLTIVANGEDIVNGAIRNGERDQVWITLASFA